MVLYAAKSRCMYRNGLCFLLFHITDHYFFLRHYRTTSTSPLMAPLFGSHYAVPGTIYCRSLWVTFTLLWTRPTSSAHLIRKNVHACIGLPRLCTKSHFSCLHQISPHDTPVLWLWHSGKEKKGCIFAPFPPCLCPA